MILALIFCLLAQTGATGPAGPVMLPGDDIYTLLSRLGTPGGWGFLVLAIGWMARKMAPVINSMGTLVQSTIKAHGDLVTSCMDQLRELSDSMRKGAVEFADHQRATDESRAIASRAQEAALSQARELLREIEEIQSRHKPT